MRPTHTAVFANFFYLKQCCNHLSPLFSPDLSLTDYFLFPKLKVKLKELHFMDVAEIEEAVTGELKKEFSAAFQKLYYCAKACICASGSYFELKKKGTCLPRVFDF